MTNRLTEEELKKFSEMVGKQHQTLASIASELLERRRAEKEQKPVASCVVDDGRILSDGFGEYTDHALPDGCHDLYVSPTINTELLEALQGLMADIGGGVKVCGHDFDCSCAFNMAKYAIAKAQGEHNDK